MTRLVGVCLALGVLCAAAAAPAIADDEPPYRPMPWHLVDVWWDLGEETPFESYSLDVSISADLPASCNLYIAPIGLAHLSDVAFYGGLQTQADGYTRQDRRLRKIGPGLLLSMWGERRFEAIRPAEGGFCQSSGHEGDFVSVRRPYAWSAGQYTYRVVRMEREDLEGQPGTWVGAFLDAHDRNETIFIGALRFPKTDLVLSRKAAGFVEVYGRRIPATEIPQVVVTFSNPRVNTRPVELHSVEAIYPRGVPDYAAARWEEGRVVITLGERVVDRTARTVRLMERAAAP